MADKHFGPSTGGPAPADQTLCAILDPEGKIAGLDEALSGIPAAVVSDIVFLTMGYGKAEIEFIASIAAKQLLCQLGCGPDNGGVLHHAAAIAPVVTSFGLDFPKATVYRYVAEMRDWLKRYWKCAPADFGLSATNRLLFARGAAMAHFVTEGEEIPCWRNDVHFIWMGSKFPDLRESAVEILNAKRIGRDFLDSLSLDWIPADKVRDDGGIDEDFLSENIDRINGRLGPCSILSGPEWENVAENSDGPELVIGPLGFTRESVIVLSHFLGAVTDDERFISALVGLAADIEDGFDAGEIALLMMDFDRITLSLLEKAVSFDEEARGLILDLLEREASYFDPEEAYRIQNMVRFVAATAPLLNEFICIDELDEDDIEEIAETMGADAERMRQTVAVEEALDFFDWVTECWNWFHAACAIEEYEVTEATYPDLARGLTACHLIGCNTLEDAEQQTVTNIGRLTDQIILHSDELVITRDLSRAGLMKIL